jgi:hypothetical protein
VAPPCRWDGQEGALEGLREMLVARRGDGFRCLLYDSIKADATERKQRKHPCTVWDVEVGEERRIQLLVSRYSYFCSCHFSLSLIIYPAYIIATPRT